jgi:hypothetical protein
MSSSFLSIDEQIAAVNGQIDKVENEIDAVARAVNEAEAAGNDRKVARLSDKEKQLREDKKQLREKEIILLKQQQQPQPSDTNLAAAIEQLQISQQRQEKAQQEAAERQEKAQQEVVSMLHKAQSEHKSMSKVNKEFAESVLEGLGMTWSACSVNDDDGRNFEFDWSGGEEANTDNAMQLLSQQASLPTVDDGKTCAFVDVRKQDLFPLSSDGKRCTGQGDLAIRPTGGGGFADNRFVHTLALTELKVSAEKIRVYQLLLQIVSLSRMSRFKQGVVVLGTDCCAGWVLVHFERRNHIVTEEFMNGSVCLQRLHELLASIESRHQSLLPLPRVDEHFVGGGMAQLLDQDVSGFDEDVSAENRHIDHHGSLQLIANALNDYTGGMADVHVPSWAMAPPPPPCFSFYA